jgi:hypothetical protein
MVNGMKCNESAGETQGKMDAEIGSRTGRAASRCLPQKMLSSDAFLGLRVRNRAGLCIFFVNVPT